MIHLTPALMDKKRFTTFGWRNEAISVRKKVCRLREILDDAKAAEIKIFEHYGLYLATYKSRPPSALSPRLTRVTAPAHPPATIGLVFFVSRPLVKLNLIQRF